jgi:HrpA-like RNA helicase
MGYYIRLDSYNSHHTKLLFCSTGILLHRLLLEPNLVGVTHVIIDEVHKCTLEGDLLLLPH